MARKQLQEGRETFKPPWKMKRTRGGVEWYSYPGALARQVLLHPRSIGRAHPPIGFAHQHQSDNGYLLHVIVSGQLWYRLNNQIFRARPDEACLLDVGEEVSYGNAGPGRAKFYWALFDGRDLPRFFQELRADRNPRLTGFDARAMRTHFENLIALIQRTPQGFDFRAAAVLTMILAELFAGRGPTVSYAELSGNARPLSEPVRKAIDFISRFYDARDDTAPPFSIKALADASGRSLSYFSRLFHREVGMSPIAYLNHFRIDHSKRLLENSDRTISQIAHRVGFSDANFFAKTFKQITGMTPQQYRRQ